MGPTDSAKISALAGPADAETLRAETDVRVGGRRTFFADRTARHDVGGIYREVERPKAGIHLGVA
jgi:uncharacterized protein YndB with AHSA1/START domain